MNFAHLTYVSLHEYPHSTPSFFSLFSLVARSPEFIISIIASINATLFTSLLSPPLCLRDLDYAHLNMPATDCNTTFVELFLVKAPDLQHESRQGSVLGVVITTCVLLVFFIGARLYARGILKNAVGSDDIVMIVAAMFALVYSAVVCRACFYGLGRHLQELDVVTKVAFYKVLGPISMTSVVELSCCDKLTVTLL